MVTASPSLKRLADILAFQASLLDDSVDKCALVELDPAESFSTALGVDGATYDDLKAFVHDLKHTNSESGNPLLTQQALVHLGAVLWNVSRTMVCQFYLLSEIHSGKAKPASLPGLQSRYAPTCE
jgi:hypothetical protein